MTCLCILKDRTQAYNDDDDDDGDGDGDDG